MMNKRIEPIVIYNFEQDLEIIDIPMVKESSMAQESAGSERVIKKAKDLIAQMREELERAKEAYEINEHFIAKLEKTPNQIIEPKDTESLENKSEQDTFEDSVSKLLSVMKDNIAESINNNNPEEVKKILNNVYYPFIVKTFILQEPINIKGEELNYNKSSDEIGKKKLLQSIINELKLLPKELNYTSNEGISYPIFYTVRMLENILNQDSSLTDEIESLGIEKRIA